MAIFSAMLYRGLSGSFFSSNCYFCPGRHSNKRAFVSKDSCGKKPARPPSVGSQSGEDGGAVVSNERQIQQLRELQHEVKFTKKTLVRRMRILVSMKMAFY